MADLGKPSATISGTADGGGEATPASPTSGGLATAPISSSNAGVSIAPAPSSGGSTPSAGESAPDTEAAGGVGGKKNHRLHRAEREADFIRMLVRGDFAALHALYESVDTGSEATVLVDASVHYFYTKGPNAQLLLELLKSLIDKEVDSTASPATLFRSNSAAAKMLSATLQHVGTKYLQMTLRRIVHEVCMSNPRIEIDPLKLKPDDNYDENLKRLTSYCELFFNTITKSIEDCPVFVRHVCEYVQMSAVRKFPESKQIRQNLSAVGGLLFLRFFCPAIFTPHKFSVVEAAPGPVALRSLILISKVMQMMANGLRFSDKAEQYMIPMNEFIDKHSADLLNFFTEASMVPSEEEIARLEQKQRQAFQERVLKDISNPLLVKTNDRISQMQDWKNNQARARAGTIESRPIAHSASSAHSGPAPSVPGSFLPSGLVARSAPDLVREMSDDAGDTVRSNTSQQLHVADREHSRDDAVTSAGSRGATDDADHPPNKRPEANAAVPPTTAAAPVAAAPHGGSGESHPRRDEREQRADWLDIIHFYLHRNLDKIRVLMQAPELHEDLKHLEKVLSAWTVPEIETEESKRDKERKERERKEKLKEKEQQEKRERELIELPAKDSPKEKDKETALEKATRRLLHKKTKNKGELETNPDLLNLEEGEDFERLVVRLKLEKEKEEEQRKHVEKEKENLKKAKEMIEKELIALIDDSKKMRVEIAKLQKDKEMVDYWRGEAEKEKAKSVSMLEEKHQLLVKLARQSDDKAALDADRVRFDAEREQMARERREADRRVRELEAALKNMTEERDELKETYKAYDARMKAEERERAKKVRERLAHGGDDDDDSNDVDKYRLVDDFDTSSSSHSISSSTSSDRTKVKERTRKKSEGAAGEAALEGDDAAAERRKERKKKRRTVHLLRTSGEQDKGSSSSITPRDSQDKGEKEKKDDKKEEKEKKEKKKRDKDDEKKEEKKDKERPAVVVGETAAAAAEVEEMSSSMSSKSSKNTKTAKKEKKEKEKEKEKETSEESPADKEAAKEAAREKRRSKRTNRTSVKKTKEDVMRDLKSEEEAQQAQEDKESKESNRDDSPRKRGVERERTKEAKEAKEAKEGVVVIATSISGSAEASVLPLATSAVVLRQSNRGGESSGDGKNEKNEAGGRAKNEGWVLSDDEDDAPKAGGDAAGIRPSETEDGDEDDTERTRKVGKVKTGSYVAPRKSTNPLRKAAEEGSGIRRSQSYDALGYKESSGKRSGGKDIDLKELGKKMRKGLELKSHKHNLKRFENCFRGVQAVEWLMQGAHVESRPEAVEVCRRLLEAGDLFVNLPGLEAEFADDDRSVYQFV